MHHHELSLTKHLQIVIAEKQKSEEYAHSYQALVFGKRRHMTQVARSSYLLRYLSIDGVKLLFANCQSY